MMPPRKQLEDLYNRLEIPARNDSPLMLSEAEVKAIREVLGTAMGVQWAHLKEYDEADGKPRAIKKACLTWLLEALERAEIILGTDVIPKLETQPNSSMEKP